MSVRNFIPPATMHQLDEYQNRRVPPGGFLHAVLANDLYNAVLHADEGNLACLQAIVGYVEGQMPISCRGSREAVQAWLNPPPPPLNESDLLANLRDGDTFVFSDEPGDQDVYTAKGSNWYASPKGGVWRGEFNRPVLVQRRA